MRNWQDAPTKETESEAAIIEYLVQIVDERVRQAGQNVLWDKGSTSYWFLFGLRLKGALIPHVNVLNDPDYLALMRDLFAEIFDFLMYAYRGDPALEMAELYRAFGSGIRCGPILLRLLPERARPQIEEMDEILDAQYEEDRRRQDQMGY